MISNSKQLNLSLIGEVPQIKDENPEIIRMFTSPYQAVRHCTRKRTDADWARITGVKQGTFNNIINADQSKSKRPRHFPLHWVDVIQRNSGCRAISQYFEFEAKGWLNSQQQIDLTTEEKAALYDQERLQA